MAQRRRAAALGIGETHFGSFAIHLQYLVKFVLTILVANGDHILIPICNWPEKREFFNYQFH